MNFVALYIHEFTGESLLETLNSEIRYNAAMVYIRDHILIDFLNVVYENDEVINITVFIETFKNDNLYFYNGHNDCDGYLSREVSDLIDWSAFPICEHVCFLSDDTIAFLSHMLWNDGRAAVRGILEIYVTNFLLPIGLA